jgi:hypothetical protein
LANRESPLGYYGVMSQTSHGNDEPDAGGIATDDGCAQFTLRWLLTLILVLSLAMGSAALLVPALLEFAKLFSRSSHGGC